MRNKQKRFSIKVILCLSALLFTAAGVLVSTPLQAQTSGSTVQIPEDARYACPMQNHPSQDDPDKQGAYFSSQPGECPRCGMQLKPLKKLDWAETQARPEPAKKQTKPSATTIPEDAEYACPMEEHPSQDDPDKQGAYFSAESGKCPRCGMKLKPLEQLDWVQARKAAKGAEVAYTCPDHQHVFSKTKGQCPRCEKELQPFKVMYTCPDPRHARVIQTEPGHCPECDKKLRPFRGIWLDSSMAEANVPSTARPNEQYAYQCPMHPLVRSNEPGRCTICAMPLQAKEDVEKAAQSTGGQQAETQPAIPENAQYVCPMKSCDYFSAEPGNCPVCGMVIKPIEEVDWARKMAQTTQPAETEKYICPMHPDVQKATKGTCSICAMQLVREDHYQQSDSAPEEIRQQCNHVTEHYLALQRRLASDSTKEVARHALGVAAASQSMLEKLEQAQIKSKQPIEQATEKLRTAALQIKGADLDEDRLHFVDLSSAMRTLLDHIRPDKDRWPELYVFYCPMSKAYWIQTTEKTKNPYYGYKMLKCGEVKKTL